MSLIFKAILLGIVQGLTEFLPISSTGHMIIVDEFLHLPEGFRDPFLVIVQLGSILSVVVYFFRRLLPKGAFTNPAIRLSTLLLWTKVIIGVFPALLIGGLFGGKIQRALYSTLTVAIALLVGGVLLILLERRKSIPRILTMPQLSWRHALGVGLAQCVAMIPGVSRSAATILGGLGIGLSRDLAVEYSFFLAIPTMCAASAYSVLKDGLSFSPDQWAATAAGFVTAFIVALGVIAGLMRFIRKHDFQLFGWYRIVLGIILLLGLAMK